MTRILTELLESECGNQRLSRKCGAVLAAVVTVLFLLCTPALASTALGNAGMLALRDGLMSQADFVPGTYPFYAALAAGESTEHIAQTLRHTVALNPGSPSLCWGLGRRWPWATAWIAATYCSALSKVEREAEGWPMWRMATKRLSMVYEERTVEVI